MPVDYDNPTSGPTNPNYGSSWGTNSTPQGYRHNHTPQLAAAHHRERSWHRPRAFRPGEHGYQEMPDDLLPPPSPQAPQLHGTGMLDRQTIMGGFQSPFGLYTPGGTSMATPGSTFDDFISGHSRRSRTQSLERSATRPSSQASQERADSPQALTTDGIGVT